MKCVSPVHVKTGKERCIVPCGKCAACIQNKRNDWATRLVLEAKYTESAYFVTLTYSDENLTYADIPNMYGEVIFNVATLVKKDVQDFMKRVRKGIKEKIRYFAVGEYGTKTWRPHYHILLFGIEKTGSRLLAYLLKKWDKGLIKVDPVNTARIKYCTNYIIQKTQFKNEFIQEPFSLQSKGLGSQYIKENNIKKHRRDLERNYLVLDGGVKAKLPRYLKKKMLSKHAILKQNKLILENNDKRELRNWEKWALTNPESNQYEYSQQVFEKFKNDQEKTYKKNNTL